MNREFKKPLIAVRFFCSSCAIHVLIPSSKCGENRGTNTILLLILGSVQGGFEIRRCLIPFKKKSARNLLGKFRECLKKITHDNYLLE